jgi:mannose-6-phosphate isomerase-like protein (cupin superfamily)
VIVKCDHALVDVTWTRYEPGERGPDPHIHRQHADAWYVLEGELTFGVGPGGEELHRAPAGTVVLVPAGVIHTFRNDGPATARFLNVHAPSMGFAESLRHAVAGTDFRWDSFDPPEDGGRSAADVIVRGSGEGESIMGGAVVFKAESSDGEGTFSLTKTTLPPGFPGPVPHVHERTLDSFYVLDGTLTLRLGDRQTDAGPSSYAIVPPGNVHTFANRTEAPVRMLNLMVPGGFEQYLKEAAAAAAAPAPGQMPDQAAMAEIASRYDFRPV